MTQEYKSQRKVDYKVLSVIKCKACNKPLKQNSYIKGHKICFVCFKIADGKQTPELLEKQKQNFRIYKGGIK